MVKKIILFFDRLEDKIRAELSQTPILYAMVAGVGIVLFWRGVWHIADAIPFFTPLVSVVVGSIILLMSGVFVSAFVGSRLIISGLNKTKKTSDKSAKEIEQEMMLEEQEIEDIRATVHKIEEELDRRK